MDLIDAQSIVLSGAIRNINVTQGAGASSMTLNMKEDCLFRGIHDSESSRSNCLSWQSSPLEIQKSL